MFGNSIDSEKKTKAFHRWRWQSHSFQNSHSATIYRYVWLFLFKRPLVDETKQCTVMKLKSVIYSNFTYRTKYWPNHNIIYCKYRYLHSTQNILQCMLFYYLDMDMLAYQIFVLSTPPRHTNTCTNIRSSIIRLPPLLVSVSS